MPSIQVLERAYRVLELLSNEPASLTELAKGVGIQKTTMHNILKTMQALGMIDRLADGKYRIGQRLAHLAEPTIKQNVLFPIANQIAHQLVAQIDETVVIAAMYKTDRYLLAHAETTQSLKVQVDVHERRSPYTAPTGRVLLAYLDAKDLDQVVQVWGLPGLEWPDVSDELSLKSTLLSIRKRGIEIDAPENGQVKRLAVPVTGPDDRVWAAIGVQLPMARMTGERETVLIQKLKESARLMSEALSVSYGKIDFQPNKS